MKRMRTKRRKRMRDRGWCRTKGIEECEWAKAVRSMGREEEGEGPKVTRGLRMTEVVMGRRDWATREESRLRGVVAKRRDGTGIALIVPFSRNGASRRSQQKDISFSGEAAAREL